MKRKMTGQLRHRITVKRMQAVPGKIGELGQDVVEEQVVGQYWASVESRTGSLLIGRTADTILTETTHVIVLRYTPDITPDCWIEFAGHTFDIDYISDPDFTRTWLEVFCRGSFC